MPEIEHVSCTHDPGWVNTIMPALLSHRSALMWGSRKPGLGGGFGNPRGLTVYV